MSESKDSRLALRGFNVRLALIAVASKRGEVQLQQASQEVACPTLNQQCCARFALSSAILCKPPHNANSSFGVAFRVAFEISHICVESQGALVKEHFLKAEALDTCCGISWYLKRQAAAALLSRPPSLDFPARSLQVALQPLFPAGFGECYDCGWPCVLASSCMSCGRWLDWFLYLNTE